MKKVILMLLLLNISNAFAQFKYPPSKTVDSADTYFGTTYKDPYRWLEHMKDTATISWFKQQADYANSITSKISGRDELLAEFKMLDKLESANYRDIVEKNGRIFYRKTLPGEPVGKLYYRPGYNGTETLLFDPTTFISGKILSIQSFIPSWDGKYIAIAYSQRGAEVSTIRVMDIDTKTLLKDKMFPVSTLDGWDFSNKAIFYIGLKSADNADPESHLNPKTRWHSIGTDAAKDIDFFSDARYPDLKLGSKAYPYIQLSADDKSHVFAGEFTVQNEFDMFYAPIDQFHSGNIKWKTFCTPADKLVRGMEFNAGKVYAISYQDAPNYKLLATNIDNPDWKHATTIAAAKPGQTLEVITHCKDYILLTYSDGINFHLVKYGFDTNKTKEVKLPFSGTLNIICLDNKTNDCVVTISSWNKPVTEFEFNATTEIFKPGKFNKTTVYPAAYLDLESKEVEVKGHDGAMIPLSIVYKKGTKLNGNNVCWMGGYGAYGQSFSPYFIPSLAALITKNVIVAIAHVRGGSEKGEAWYKAGYKTTKPNTWKDFNSCAEYLIANGYTQPAKLAGMGTSAGGILISRAITERPDLYAAVICNVGCANTMRGEFSANGPANIPEFGTVKDSIECKALFEMDGTQHVVPGTKYPAVICVAGWNDPRVIAWEPGKFAAALQNASTSGRPVLLKVNYDNGHFTEDKDVANAGAADKYAFVLWQCGHPDFQLKKPH